MYKEIYQNTDWSRVIAVTNRRLCEGDFTEQIRKICELGVRAVILREKDLPEEEYQKLAERVLEISEKFSVPCILHQYVDVAGRLGCKRIHLPLHLLLEEKNKKENRLHDFTQIGASIHSVSDAIAAQKAGATYLTAGHIYPTSCKPGLAPRGISFLEEVCKSVTIPVYAIGGIHAEQIPEVLKAGATGACMMSELMKKINKNKAAP